MKKHLIAAAVATAIAAPAMAQVTVYGLLDIGVQAVDTRTAAGVSTDTSSYGESGRLSGSRLGFRGTEDLGGGLKAGFVWEQGLDSSDASIAANGRLSFVELSGGFGTVRLGRQVTPQKATTDAFYATGNSTFAPGNIGIAMDTDGERVSKALTYLSPAFSGFQFQLQAAGADSDANNAADKTSSKQMNYGASFTAGPFRAGVGVNDVDAKAEAGNQDEIKYTAFGLSYDFGVARVFALQSEKETKRMGVAVRADAEETVIGVQIPVGNLTLTAQFADGESNALGAAAKTDRDGYQLIAVYNLSKRTNVYAAYGDDDNKTAGSNGEATQDGFTIGVRHSF